MDIALPPPPSLPVPTAKSMSSSTSPTHAKARNGDEGFDGTVYDGVFRLRHNTQWWWIWTHGCCRQLWIWTRGCCCRWNQIRTRGLYMVQGWLQPCWQRWKNRSMVKMRWRGATTGMKRNKTFVIIVECYVSNGKPHRTLCCQNLPLHFFAFACVGEVDGDTDFVASSDGEGGVEV